MPLLGNVLFEKDIHKRICWFSWGWWNLHWKLL